MASKRQSFRQGIYRPKNPYKYIGDVSKITYRSSWELEFCKFLDNNKNVLKWASEEIAIPYIKPTDNKVHKYYPDFFIMYIDKNGNVKKELVEIKPKKQTMPPKKNKKKNKTHLIESLQYAVNVAKWQAAAEWCINKGITFRVITEQDMFKG